MSCKWSETTDVFRTRLAQNFSRTQRRIENKNNSGDVYFFADLVSVPTMSFGGMENWGLITYQPNRLLFDETQSDSEDRMDLAVTISHEILHNVSTLTVVLSRPCYKYSPSTYTSLYVNIAGKFCR